jgi:hypothetical protein
MSLSKTKILPLKDEEGNFLPKNMSRQFRDVQSGIEFLKDAADSITIELKGVNHKLGSNTTDLGVITKKVNDIDKKLNMHMKQTKAAFKKSEQTTQALLDLIKNVFDVVSKSNVK